MLRNLVAEMARHQISEKQLAALFSKDYRWIRRRINEETMKSGEHAQFGTLDLIKIRKAYFPGCTLEYLAESDHDPSKSA